MPPEVTFAIRTERPPQLRCSEDTWSREVARYWAQLVTVRRARCLRRWWEDPRWRSVLRARAEHARQPSSTPRSLRTVCTERARPPTALRVLTTPTHGPPLAHAEPGGALSV
jgi:hypothetical protein